MELQCSCHTVRKYEDLARSLVENDMARIIKHDTKKNTDGSIRERVCVYEAAIGDFGGTTIYVRFWEDKSHDRASIQMSHEALDALLESVTVMGLMMKLGQKVDKNGNGINIEQLKVLVMEATKKLTGKEEDIKVIP